jgi:hypothetical protein
VAQHEHRIAECGGAEKHPRLRFRWSLVEVEGGTEMEKQEGKEKEKEKRGDQECEIGWMMLWQGCGSTR